jgi:hypothetical protein
LAFPARIAFSSLPFCFLPMLQARAAVTTGITGGSMAAFLFAVAAVLLLTLVFRAVANQFVAAVLARIGAIRVRQVLKAQGPTVLHDLVLPGAYGGLVRIDHVVLTAGGILCILRIPCRGLVFGGSDEPQWSNVDGTVRHRFLNPLISNEGQVRALRETVPGVPVAGVAVFTGGVEFSCAPPANVILISQLQAFIANHVFEPSKVEDWDAVWLTVRSADVSGAAGLKNLPAGTA